MGATESDSSETWRLLGAALLFAVVCAGGALIALRADAQPPAVATAAAVGTIAPASTAGSAGTIAPAGTVAPVDKVAPTGTAAPAGKAAAGGMGASPSPTDEIPDDPTVAPDSRQKADDNVSFPVDI